MRYYLESSVLGGPLRFAISIKGDYADTTYWEPYSEPPITFNSRAEAQLVASSIKNNFQPVSEDEIEGRHTPTGFRYRRKPK